ncbi:MAG: glycoside hydrolase family 2 TIM barrel-domain containing protein [Bacillota bacterium]
MKKIININENWSFTKEGETIIVNLPHTYNAVDGQTTAHYYKGKVQYSKTLTDLKGTCYIEIGAANSVAEVIFNGSSLGVHKGGYSMFRYDLTKHIIAGANNLVIEVDNSDSEEIYPAKADFTFYGGLYRDVNLITEVDDIHFELIGRGFDSVHATPTVVGDDGFIDVKTYAVGGDKVRFTLFDKVGEAVLTVESSDTKQNKLTLQNPTLWDGVKNPYLYKLQCELLKDNEVRDTTSVIIGFRTIVFDDSKGCFLNGKHVKLKGVSRHQDRLGMGNALTEKEHREDLELIKEVGANSIRLAHYQHDKTFYDICDEMGFLVWAEVPVITLFSEQKQENAESQLRELITQNYNHPCIFCWGVQNEISVNGAAKGLVEGITKLNTLAKSLDASRPTTSAQVMMAGVKHPLNDITDILGYNLYFGWYVETTARLDVWLKEFREANPNRSLCLSEYGAEGILKYQTDKGVQGDYTEDYQARYHRDYLEIINKYDWMWGSYVWNMFDFGSAIRDEGGVQGRNNKGLITLDRKTKKDSFYVYKAYWSDEKFVHIGGERYVNRVVGKSTISVISNMEDIVLLVNGTRHDLSGSKVMYAEVDIISGENIVQATSGGLTHTIKINGVQEADQSYKLPSEIKSFIRNWFADVEFDPAARFGLNDRVYKLWKSPEIDSFKKMALGEKKVNPLLLAAIKPFKIGTLLKLAKVDKSMVEMLQKFLQTIEK